MAAVDFPILGNDFLAANLLLVDPAKPAVIHRPSGRLLPLSPSPSNPPVLHSLPDLPPVHDPDLPAPSTVDEGNLAEPIFLTAPQSPMEEGTEPNFFANENNYIVKASLIKQQ